MTRTYSLRFVALFVLLFSVFSVHVFADEERGKGFLTLVNDYFGNNTEIEIEEIPEPSVSVIDNSPPMLMSVSPEDIANGVLQLNYSSVLDCIPTSNVGYVSVNSSSVMNSVRTVGMTYNISDDASLTYTDTISIKSSDTIVDKGEIFDFYLNGITNWWDYEKTTDGGTAVINCFCEDASKIDVTVYFSYYGGEKVIANVDELKLTVDSSGRYYYLSVSVTEPLAYDLIAIDIVMKYDVTDAFGMPDVAARYSDTTYASYIPHHTVGFYNSDFVLSIIDQTNGLLGGIIDWLKGIWEGITSLPGKIVSGLGDLLKSLFIPSSESLKELEIKYDTFFSEHFGFVYQSASIVVELFNTIINSSAEVVSTVTFPVFEYDFGDGALFTFGGYEVDVVPDGFEGIVNTLKLVVNIVVTLAFLSLGMKYFEKFINK